MILWNGDARYPTVCILPPRHCPQAGVFWPFRTIRTSMYTVRATHHFGQDSALVPSDRPGRRNAGCPRSRRRCETWAGIIWATHEPRNHDKNGATYDGAADVATPRSRKTSETWGTRRLEFIPHRTQIGYITSRLTQPQFTTCKCTSPQAVVTTFPTSHTLLLVIPSTIS